MHKLLQLLRFFSVPFFFVIYGHASIPISIDMNSSISGEWTSESNRSVHHPVAYIDYYTFTLNKNTFIQIDLTSTDVNPYLYLFDEDNQIIDENADSGENVNARLIKYLEPGIYTIGARNPIDYVFGNYNLTLNQAIIPVSTNIMLNSMEVGELTTSSDISLYSMNYSSNYSFTLAERKNIAIVLKADYYSKNVYLLDSNNSIIENVSEYSAGSSKIIKTLEAGTYTIDVTTKSENKTGEFTLSLKENIIESNYIELESITDGEWTNSSGISPRSKNYANYYTFTLTERKNIIIDLDGSYTKELYLLDSNGSIIESDLSNSHGHTKIIKTLDAGSYTIDVTNDYEDSVGIYTLRFKENIISNSNISVGSSVDGAWNISSGASPRSKNYTNYYTFTVLERTDIIVTLKGNSSYKKLYLLDVNNTIVNALENSSYSNTRLIVTLEAGTYKIDATTSGFSNSTLGNYTLNIKENIILTTEVELNTTTAGEWLSTSGISPRGNSYSNNYIFTLTERKDIVITLELDNSRGGVYLLDVNNSILESGFGYSSKNTRLIKTLEAGTYAIDVTMNDNSPFGDYNLSLQENIVSNVNIELNSTTDGEWLSTSGISPRSTRSANYYTFTLDKPTDVLIDLVSDNHESLFLLDSNKTMINSAWSRRVVKRLEAGTYIIDATLNSGIEVGSYTLIVKENIISNTEIVFNQETYGKWISASGISPRSERYANYYTFTLANSKEITINMVSENDTTFYIQDESGGVFASALGYGDQNATLTRLFHAGTYIISVTTNDGDEIGNYSLLLSADIAIPTSVTQLFISNIGSYATKITWIDNLEDVVGYRIYINNQLVDMIDGGMNYYNIGSLKPDTNYTYSIVSYNSAGESEAASGTFKTKKDDYAWLVPVYHTVLY